MSLDVGANNASRMVGPTVGGLLLASVGIEGVFLLSVAMYGGALIARRGCGRAFLARRGQARCWRGSPKAWSSCAATSG